MEIFSKLHITRALQRFRRVLLHFLRQGLPSPDELRYGQFRDGTGL